MSFSNFLVVQFRWFELIITLGAPNLGREIFRRGIVRDRPNANEHETVPSFSVVRLYDEAAYLFSLSLKKLWCWKSLTHLPLQNLRVVWFVPDFVLYQRRILTLERVQSGVFQTLHLFNYGSLSSQSALICHNLCEKYLPKSVTGATNPSGS